jgi:hypothetical protein
LSDDDMMLSKKNVCPTRIQKRRRRIFEKVFRLI